MDFPHCISNRGYGLSIPRSTGSPKVCRVTRQRGLWGICCVLGLCISAFCRLFNEILGQGIQKPSRCYQVTRAFGTGILPRGGVGGLMKPTPRGCSPEGRPVVAKLACAESETLFLNPWFPKDPPKAHPATLQKTHPLQLDLLGGEKPAETPCPLPERNPSGTVNTFFSLANFLISPLSMFM